MKPSTKNYKELALAILRQAQIDYCKDTAKILVDKEIIAKLKAKSSYPTKGDQERVSMLEEDIRFRESDKNGILKYWENASKLGIYDDLINEELGYQRFKEEEERITQEINKRNKK